MKFRKKPVVIEAYQWISGSDDHVKYYQYPDKEGRCCKHCGRHMNTHGWIDTLESGHIVCPLDWVIKGIKGEFYPCKPDIFEATYEAVE